ncbi:MAG TPA: enoyl-CoA hydratase-related protein [Streptosporangiaceae bacterium]
MDLTGPQPLRELRLDRDGQAVIDDRLISALHQGLDAAEADPDCRLVVLTSAPGTFCTGMDLTAVGAAPAPSSQPPAAAGAAGEAGGAFFDLLRRFTSTPRIVVSAVDGQVAGGGLGLIGASDLVCATERSTFALPEALWGLLPCCVLPFLIRRTGFQQAYAMALTTQPADAARALACGLADMVADDPGRQLRRLAFRASKLDPATIGALKRYASRLWEISDSTRQLAVTELGRVMARPAVRQNLAAYAARGRFPWER